jgi:hypothetical protein
LFLFCEQLIGEYCDITVLQISDYCISKHSKIFLYLWALTFRVPEDYFFTLSSYSASNNLIHISNHQNNSLNSTFLSLWPTNTICERNDDYESYESNHQQEEQQPILNHQQQGEQGENKPYHSKINYLETRQMGDNINNSNEQRQFSGGGGGGNGSNNNNIVSRKKTNNGKREKQANL